MPQDLSARLATMIDIGMMGDANIDDAFARSQLTLHADQIPKAIGEGAISFLQGFGKRSVEAMRGRSPVLLQNSRGDQSSMGERSPLQVSEGKREGRSLILPKLRESDRFSARFWEAIGGGDEGAIALTH